MSNIHVVFAHPAERSFTRDVLHAFLGGAAEGGHTHTVSDLYAMRFRPDLTAEEYDRESGRRPDAPVRGDVRAEHERLAAADVWVFVYPVWWADCPALLKGWFDRVWTVGFAYRPGPARPARKALVLCTAGHTVEELEASGCHQAMRTVMLTDRIGARAAAADLVVFGGAAHPGTWPAVGAEHLRRAADLGRGI